jgi:NADPH-dependent 2,4-dienoyl-CoA reductase/sulfur reductase-like enzyme
VEAGCDFIGIHGAHGYLLAQFLSPYCNKREDDYGGDLAGRLRFPLEVVTAIRRAVGPDVPLVYRITADEHHDGGLTLGDVCEAAPHLEGAGVDLLDVTAGMPETNWWVTQPMEMPQAVLSPLARAVRARVKVPVSVAGRISDPSVAEHVLEARDADFVTLGRALHADPEFPNKARQGRLQEICTCIACNQGCLGVHATGSPILCMVNTTTGREREYAIRPARPAGRVLVVGAGPAGLECARVLALRGHRVTVFERGNEPGGQLLMSRLVPGRAELAGHVPWLIDAAIRAGVRLELGVDVTAGIALDEHADIVVVATGATPGVPQIPGIGDSPVVDPFEVLRRPIGGDRRALVIGGGILGVGLARVLAGRGVQVVLTEPGKELVADIAIRSRRFHTEALLDMPNVTVHTGTTVEALGECNATLWNGREQFELGAIDFVVPARPMLPVTDLADALYAREDAPPLFVVGDCVQPRTALQAIHDAAALGHRL